MEFITETTLPQGVAWLCDRDLDLTRLVDRHGPPTRLWIRPPGFPTLVRIILEQQVSLASAQSTFDRLNAAIHLTPDRLLTLETDQLKGLGLSRQKAHYVQILAQAILSGELSLDPLAQQSDEAVRTELCKLKGIGPWTAEMYLMMALRRSDAWPVGDLALQIATQRLKGDRKSVV